jgi:hypothetical protein
MDSRLADDKQLIEVIGKAKFTEFAIRSGFEVAMPVRDCGIDVLLYFPIEDNLLTTTIPVQLKCYSSQALTVDSKYNRMGDLLHVVLWNCTNKEPSFFALTQKHSMHFAEMFGWDKLPGWINKKGRYDATKATTRIIDEMRQYRTITETFKNMVKRYYSL